VRTLHQAAFGRAISLDGSDESYHAALAGIHRYGVSINLIPLQQRAGLFYGFDIRWLSEERIGNRFVEFNRFVIDAAGLDAVAEVIDHVRCDDAIDGDWFQESVLFGELFHFIAIGFLVLALVDHFCGQALAGGK